MKTSDNTTERLAADLKRIVGDSEDLLHATKDAAGEKAHEIRERLAASLETARRACQRLEEKAVDAAKSADRTIREHPYQSVGIAFGFGLLIGVLVAKKK